MTLDEAIAADVLGTATLTASCGCRLMVSPCGDEEDGQYTLSIISCEGGVWGPLSISAHALAIIIDGEAQEWRTQATARAVSDQITRAVFDALTGNLAGARGGVND